MFDLGHKISASSALLLFASLALRRSATVFAGILGDQGDGVMGDLTLEQYAAAQLTVSTVARPTNTTLPIVSEADLSAFIFQNYLKTRRPRRDALQVVDVFFGLSLIAINHILEREQEMVTTVHLTLQWRDDFLVWNTSEHFSQLTSLSVFANEVWLPDYSNVNSGNMYSLFQSSQLMLLTINNDGWIEYLPEATITTFCDMDLTFFPYDEQICPIRFEAWTYFPPQEMFKLYDPPTNTHKYRRNEQWDLLDLSAHPYISCYTNSTTDCCYTGMEFLIHVRRKAAYYNINIIAPSLIIAFVEIVIFALPTHEPQKIHISFTCLLAYAVFQDTVSQEMPRTSEHPPLLSIFLNLQMAYIGVALVGEGAVFMCGNRASRRQSVPWYLLLVGEYLGRYLLIEADSVVITDDKEDAAMTAEVALREIRKDFIAVEPIITNNHHYQKQALDDPMGEMAAPPPPNTWIDEHQISYSNVSPAPVHRHPSNRFPNPSISYMDENHFPRRRKEKIDQTSKGETFRFQWLYLAEVVDRSTLIIYLLLISITPMVIFWILPSIHENGKQ